MSEYESEYAEDQQYQFTPTKAVLRGEFSISDYTVPYYQGNLTLEETSRYLKLVEDMPTDQRHKWTIEELFQRDIDWERVNDDIVVNYLKRKEKRSFFNALTVALLPTRSDGHLDSQYTEKAYSFPIEAPFSDENYQECKIGGIQIAARDLSASSIQYIRWDEKSIFAAAIDGQHRLAALRKFSADTPLSVEQRNTRIPVIFLVLDPQVGFDVPQLEGEGTDNPLLIAVREIFIDLNKHSKEVSTARQILLDDQELEARCTRLLLANKTLVDSKEELPLGLVNWKTSTVKFDKGPYFTSITALYLVVKDYLSLKYPEDPLDEEQVYQFISSVEDKLYLRETIEEASGPLAATYKDRIPIEQFVQNKFDEENPDPIKNLPYIYANAAVDSFRALYQPLILHIFTSFKPYADFWSLSEDLGGIDGVFAQFHSLNKKGQDIFQEELGDRFEDEILAVEEKLVDQKKGKWPFMVVWQKALLKASITLYFQKSAVLGDQADDYLKLWIEFLDDLYLRSIFDTECPLDETKQSEGDLWEGVAKNPVSQTIRYSNAAANKIADLLSLLWYAKIADASSSQEFIDLIMESSSNAKYPGGKRLLGSLLKSQKSVAVQRFQIEDEEEIETKCRTRVKAILGRTGLTE